ncbi:MAG: type II secretion system F family protein [Acidimicrobiia bacterium]
MLTTLALGLALLAGAHPLVVGVVALALVRPGWFLTAAMGWGLVWHWQARRRTRSPVGAEAAFLQGMAAELGAGASLRAALESAATRAPELPLAKAVRLARAGRPAAEVAGGLAEALPENGPMAGLAFRTAASTGAKAGAVLAGLALRAAEEDELARERRALTAQARLSAWLVGGAALAVPIVLVATERAELLVESGRAGLVLLAAGLGLELLGVLMVWWMLGRAER